ncbi:MAG: malto-oligosyltrehalose trehalohydrolase [Acidobacteria bacterium]|nr:malto-oligosyltrehalose trehalohydrolase [Acidobacteriota bacterium]
MRPPVLGATRTADGRWQFVVWAPKRKSVELLLLPSQSASGEATPSSAAKSVVMERVSAGYFCVALEGVEPGTRYSYRLDGGDSRPDPASRFQPDGVHGPSQVVDTSKFQWTDQTWKGVSLRDTIFYELHVGTFTSEGTISALIPHLDKLAALGVTTIELMPLSQFPGGRNWGYDGVFPFALQNSYGSVADLQRFVDAAHAKKLAVCLDVVYNHLGPEGNYLNEYGPYFTDFYHTPWGSALNFDGRQSDDVRNFFIQSARYWLEQLHFDALRLDAVHSIYDASANPFLAEVSNEVRALSRRLGREIVLIAESDLNDARMVLPTGPEAQGLGMHGQWADDFHHSLHTLITKERAGYYGDFGTIRHLVKTISNGWYYDGIYAPHRERRHGNSPLKLEPEQFVVCIQNHDQVGNRALGDRISQLTDFEGLKLVAGVTLLSSFTPLLFMGEEYGEKAPFQYFTSHGDPGLADAVRKGRQAEFAHFGWKGQIPDPQSEDTFVRSRLDHSLPDHEPHRTLWLFYQSLLEYRRPRRLSDVRPTTVDELPNALFVLQETDVARIAALFHFGEATSKVSFKLPTGTWKKQIDSADPKWKGPSALPEKIEGSNTTQLTLQPRSFVVFEQTNIDSKPQRN